MSTGDGPRFVCWFVARKEGVEAPEEDVVAVATLGMDPVAVRFQEWLALGRSLRVKKSVLADPNAQEEIWKLPAATTQQCSNQIESSLGHASPSTSERIFLDISTGDGPRFVCWFVARKEGVEAPEEDVVAVATLGMDPVAVRFQMFKPD
ncbi:unnamed protein product, partial [Cyprideis torosa]